MTNYNKQNIIFTYRQLLREVNKQFTQYNKSPLWRNELLNSFKIINNNKIEDANDILCYLKSNRRYDELLKSFNPLHGATEEHKIELAANRVGLGLPLMYNENDAIDDNNSNNKDDVNKEIDEIDTKTDKEKLWKSPSWKSQFNFVKFTKTLRKAKTAYPYEKMIQSFIFDYSEIVISPEDLSLISKRCKNIKYVRFKTLSASFTAETVAAFLENCSSLVSFTITDKPLKSRLANALKPIRDGHCSKLSYLELRNFKWKIDILKDIGRACPLINTLVVSNVITNVIAAVIVEFFVNLENFTCNSITGAGFRNLFSSWSSSSSACCQKNTRKKLKKISLEFPYITLDDLYLNSLQSFKEFPPLESLTLRFGSYFGFRHFLNLWVQNEMYLRYIELDSAPGFPDDLFITMTKHCNQLESVKLKSCVTLTDISIMTLSKFHNNLKELKIIDCNLLTDKSILTIANYCTNLKRFVLLGCLNITYDSLSKIVKNCKNLFEFSFTNRPKMTPNIIMDLIMNKRCNLEYLDIRSDNLATADDDSADIRHHPSYKFDFYLLENLAKECCNIKSLSLRFNIIGLSPDELIESMSKFKNLELLTLGNNDFKREHIIKLESHKRLKEVRFVNYYILDLDARIYLAYKRSKEKSIGPHFSFIL
ncbi:10236_t:CDS:2 [Entrophospora sp. SA101]|nr:13451_t:CDS:2 [Entrophospora sp. SA101]CAJ0826758.1 354_t:CDS:2 [Entrophospora sp. SA101]CAJ0847136.1 10236_t:CDS:2 [Entrophospora sp. SA101]